MKILVAARSAWTGALVVAVLLAAMVSSAPAQTAEEVVAKSVKAQGGKDALTKLKALERKGTVSVDGAFGQMDGTVEEISIPWKKARRSLDLTVFQQKDGFDGKAAWRDGMQGVQDLEGEEANQIRQVVDLNPLMLAAERGAKIEKLDDETIDEKPCYVLQITAKERTPIKFFIDKETDLIKRLQLTQNNPQFGEVLIKIDTSDYQQFGPVKLPNKNKTELGDVLKMETTYTETKIDGAVDEALFEKPKESAAQ